MIATYHPRAGDTGLPIRVATDRGEAPVDLGPGTSCGAGGSTSADDPADPLPSCSRFVCMQPGWARGACVCPPYDCYVLAFRCGVDFLDGCHVTCGTFDATRRPQATLDVVTSPGRLH